MNTKITVFLTIVLALAGCTKSSANDNKMVGSWVDQEKSIYSLKIVAPNENGTYKITRLKNGSPFAEIMAKETATNMVCDVQNFCFEYVPSSNEIVATDTDHVFKFKKAQ